MKPILIALILLTGALLYVSCKKEYSCENCRETNSPPIADAGKDTIIVLPVDSISLDGNASSDPDGTISSFQWTKISGTASLIIINASAARTTLKNLAVGSYQFELKITDNGGLSAKDTVQLIVDSVVTTNHPPVANAGTAKTITLPANTINLDGSGSSDPDSNITSFAWTKISGPSFFDITNTNSVQTQVNNLVEGVYQFELKVTDAGGLFSKDTVLITVANVFVDCNGDTRTRIQAQLIPVSTLSMTREGMAIASIGNKILFAGGYTGNYSSGFRVYSRVDIFDITTNSWTTAELSQARTDMATAVLNNRIYFAGGNHGGGFSSRVDIYDAVTNIWTTAELSRGRALITGVAAGNKVLFAGGYGIASNAPPVDIYDASTNTWSSDSLRNRPTATRIVDSGIAGTAIGNKIYFAGNASDWLGWDFGYITSAINIYDVSTNAWSTSDLSIARGFMAAIAVGNKNYWAGGVNDQSNNYTNLVEIRDMNSGSSTFSCLSHANAFFSAIQKNNKIVFFTLGPNMPVDWPNSVWQNTFDIYDITTNTWAIGVLPVSMGSTLIISVNNVIYLAGGLVNGALSNQVWKLEF